MPTEIRWTPERLDRLRLMVKTMSAGMIAAELGVTRNAVMGICHRAGIQLEAHGVRANRSIETKTRRGTGLPKPPAVSPAPTWQEPAFMYTPPRFKPKPLPPGATCHPVPLFDLEDWHCREIVGHDGTCALHCGSRKFKGSSYCRPHAQKNQPGLFLKYMRAAE
jgi:hypothetical protein